MPSPAPCRKPPTPVKMWAVVVIHPRADWIHWGTIERTRRASWESFLSIWDFEGQQARRRDLTLGRYRVVRVIVQEARPK